MKRNSTAGFSLVEMIIAIGLVAVLAAIAFPSFINYTAPFRVQSAGREVYSALQDARQQAITRGTRTRFELVGSDRYTLKWDDAGTWRIIRGPMQLEKGVQLTSTGGDLTFQPRGTVSPMSTLTVSDVTKPEYDMVVTVPITGLIRIQKAGGGG